MPGDADGGGPLRSFGAALCRAPPRAVSGLWGSWFLGFWVGLAGSLPIQVQPILETSGCDLRGHFECYGVAEAVVRQTRGSQGVGGGAALQLLNNFAWARADARSHARRLGDPSSQPIDQPRSLRPDSESTGPLAAPHGRRLGRRCRVVWDH